MMFLSSLKKKRFNSESKEFASSGNNFFSFRVVPFHHKTYGVGIH